MTANEAYEERFMLHVAKQFEGAPEGLVARAAVKELMRLAPDDRTDEPEADAELAMGL